MAPPVPPRVLLDDTVLAAALAGDRAANALLGGPLIPVITRAAVDTAVQRVTGKPDPRAIEALMAACELTLLAPQAWVDRLKGSAFPPELAAILATAAHAETSYLATHHQQLLEMAANIAQTFEITVATPEDLLRLLAPERGPARA
jgi:hypothetical protein